MSVSSRLRYEILRRDGHACRYCGAKAPDVALTVDHVVPVALGGQDEPENLVTACADCNSGKSSSNPDAPLVANVADDALRWAAAVQAAAEIQAADRGHRDAYADAFLAEWGPHYVGEAVASGEPEQLDLPADWRDSLHRLFDVGIEPEVVAGAVASTMASEIIPGDRLFRYFCGICWRVHRDRLDIAKSLYETGGS